MILFLISCCSFGLQLSFFFVCLNWLAQILVCIIFVTVEVQIFQFYPTVKDINCVQKGFEKDPLFLGLGGGG